MEMQEKFLISHIIILRYVAHYIMIQIDASTVLV